MGQNAKRTDGLRHSQRQQHGRRHTRGHLATDQRDDRHTGPQRIATGGVTVINLRTGVTHESKHKQRNCVCIPANQASVVREPQIHRQAGTQSKS